MSRGSVTVLEYDAAMTARWRQRRTQWQANPDDQVALQAYIAARYEARLAVRCDLLIRARFPAQTFASQYGRWAEVINREYGVLVERSKKGRATLLDEYGATHVSEFFAVATECFFERGPRMRKRHRELYEVLKAYYRQDPSEWMKRKKG